MASATWKSNPWVWCIGFKVLAPGEWETGPAEHPILFSGSMVRAILEGRKTQTRRVMSPQPDYVSLAGTLVEWDDGKRRSCPYGKPGDRLWVRETWRPLWTSMGEGTELEFRAGGCHRGKVYAPTKMGTDRWRPSIHMPRWACRLVLEVTDVRVERLHEISEADAKAEGPPRLETYRTAREAFSDLWSSIHG